MMNVFDSHAHIDCLENVESSIQEAKKAGIVGIIAPGLDIVSSKKLLNISQNYPNFLYPSIGYYPWEINLEKNDEILEEIDELLPYYFALGEIGLDYKSKINKNVQKETFAHLLKIAKKHEKPVIIHVRYVHNSAFNMVKEAGISRAVFHSFNGDLEVLNKIVDAGYYVSAAPSVTYNEFHKNAILNTPIENLLLETDTPIPYRDFISRPIHVIETLKGVAHLKNIDIQHVADQTLFNTKKFLDIK